MHVRIYQPSKSTTQSGRARRDFWVLEYETENKSYPQPQKGWTASGDTLKQVVLEFPNVDDAVAYAEKNGWDYTVLPTHSRQVVPRNYGDNFRYIPPEDKSA